MPSTSWREELEIAAVIAIIRTSGGVGDKTSCAHYEQRAKRLIEALAYEHSVLHRDCKCHPDGYAIFLQSVSSNLDISQLSQPVSCRAAQLTSTMRGFANPQAGS